jgi:Gpi18-like mannosyltransferase
MPSIFTRAFSRLDASVRESLFVFVLSRGLVLLIFILVGQLKIGAPEIGSGPSGPIAARNAVISLTHAPIGRTLRETIAQGDVNHYVELSRTGYDARPFGTDARTSSLYAFCPVIPALLWLIGKTGLDVLLAGSLLSHLFFFGALILFHKLVVALGYDVSTAGRALFYLAFFPASYFFSLPMTESTFLLVTLASFYAATSSKWLASGVFGAIASATRLNGILVAPALAVLWWERERARSIWQLIAVALTPLGLLVYMFLSWRWSGAALAATKASADRHGGFFLTPLWQYLRDPGTIALPWNFVSVNFLLALLAFAAIYFLIRQRQMALAVYVALMVLVPLSTSTLVSLGRYLSVCFPIFIALGGVGSSSRIDQIIRIVFISLFVLMTAAFAARFTMALT